MLDIIKLHLILTAVELLLAQRHYSGALGAVNVDADLVALYEICMIAEK
jgi:hypothetical protein